MNEDVSHLKTLSIAHYAVGGIIAFFGCLPLMHVAMGLALVSGMGESFPGAAETANHMDSFVGWMFVGIGLFAFIMVQAMALVMIFSGSFLRKRRHYMFSFVVACVACAFVPFGTVLGVFTIIVLSRESVKSLYGLGHPVAGQTY